MAGGAFGGVLSVVISVLMDYLASDAMQGTWRDAIVMDMERYFSLTISPDGFVAYVLFVLIMLLLAAIGAAMGAAFGLLIHKFMSVLES